jgi:phytoene desaturase
MGPTILTVPSVLKRIFGEANRRMEDYLDLVRLDPQWRCFFEDSTTLDLQENVDRMCQHLASYAPNSADGYRAFVKHSEKLHEISDRYFFYKPVGAMRDMFDASNAFRASTLRDVMSMRMGRSVASTVRSYVPDARVAQMIDHFTQYVGSAPDQSPAVLCGIASMQIKEGVWYPIGGTGAVPKALRQLASELGVEFRTGTHVSRIRLQGSKAVGIETKAGEFIPLAAVVSNSDVVRSHRELVGGVPQNRFNKRRDYEPACSGVVLYLGLSRGYGHLLHHNFVFSRDPHEEFEYIYRKGQPAPDPTCYVCAPARTETAVAPRGGEALYVLVHTPYLRPGHDWRKMLPDYRNVIIEKLKRVAGLGDIEQRIVCEDALTPQGINDRYHVLNGAIYGLASHGKFMGAFKPSNRSPDVRGLYFAGGSAHPGPGMPMALMSGWIAADALDTDGVAPRVGAEEANAQR